MIAFITIRSFKGIQNLENLELGPFHVLVGPNASGKSTFLDAIEFVRSSLEHGPMKAVEERAPEFRDLTFMRRGGAIEIEFWLDLSLLLESQKDNLLHYRVAFREDDRLGVRVDDEVLKQYSRSWLRRPDAPEFSTKVTPKRLLGKTSKGTDFYTREKGKYQDSLVFGLDKLTLAHIPPDLERYPTGNAVKQFLMQGVQFVQLNSRAMRDPCPATRPTDLLLDGTNLARVVGRLRGENGVSGRPDPKGIAALKRWTEHLQYALPSLREIGWARREPDNAEYVILKFKDGLQCPSWLLSDGTLRLLALTLPAFLPPNPSIFLVEEPENGVHPPALETIIRSLSAIPRAQMLVASHSPLVVQQVGVERLLCFSRGKAGTTVIPGADHPVLKAWEGIPDLSEIFSSGVLG